MLPSPLSSRSSFRDYYQHSSQNSVLENNLSDTIGIGFRNFQVSKILQKIDNRIQQKIYWITFVSFKKISLQSANDYHKIAAKQKLKRVVTKQTMFDQTALLKNNFLKELLWNMRFQRKRQIRTMMNLCIGFSKKYRQHISVSYYAICKLESKQKYESHKDITRYVKKLSKAMLCIIFRNLLQKKIKKYLELIKKSQVHQISTSSIRFFKPKKGRQVYEHKVDEKIKKLNNFIHFFKVIAKKLNKRCELFLEQLKNVDRSSQRDSLQIMTNAVKHMIYLTAKENIALEKQNQANLKVKGLRLQNLAKRIERKSKKRVRQYVYHWRDITSQNSRHLGQQIERLLLLKQKILEDI